MRHPETGKKERRNLTTERTESTEKREGREFQRVCPQISRRSPTAGGFG